MITRIFRVVIHDGKQDEFLEFFTNIALPIVKSQQGLISLSIGKPFSSSPNEFSMVMLWKDVVSIKAFSGESWQEARIEPEEAHLIKESFVHHYFHVVETRND